MATSFFFMTKNEKGDAPLFVRLQSRKHHINYKMTTNLIVNVKEFEDNHSETSKWRKYSAKNSALCKKVDAIADALDNSVACKEEAMEIINGLGEIAGARDTEALADALNSYAEKMEEADRWEALAKRFDTLKATLEEEVEIEAVEK